MNDLLYHMKTSPRLIIASLVPFKHYVRVRFTGKIRIVQYDGKKEIFRSSLLPRPERPIDVRYSRYGLYKKGFPKMSLRKIAKAFLSSLPRDNRSYRFLLRLSKLRRRGLRYFIDRTRSRIAREIGIITPEYIGKLMKAYDAEGYEIVKRRFIAKFKAFFTRKKIKIISFGKRSLVLYLKKSSD